MPLLSLWRGDGMKFKRADGKIVEVKNKDTIKRLKNDGRFKIVEDEPTVNQELTFDDLKKKSGGYYYTPDGELFAHGEDSARNKLGDIDE